MKSIITLTLPLIAGLLIGCNQNGESSLESISDIYWEVEAIVGFDKSLEGMKGLPNVTFQIADSSFSGHSGCNSFRGTFKYDGTILEFLPAMMTKMACPDEGLEFEYVKALTSSNNFILESEKLSFFLDDELKVTFTKGGE